MSHLFAYKFIAGFYDLLDVTYFRKKETSPRKTLIDLVPEGKVLLVDVCTGTAANAIGIAQRRKEVRIIGIDLSREMLSIAEKKIKKLGLSNIETRQEDATATGFEDGTFDGAILSLVLHENSPENNRRLLLEIGRILKPKGHLIVVEWEPPKTAFQKIAFAFIKMLEPKGFRNFLTQDLAAFLEENGFAMDEERHCDYSKVLSLKKRDK